jgi:hypothetical protein
MKIKFNSKAIFATLAILLFLSGNNLFSQSKFQKVYAPNGDAIGKAIVQAADKGYLTFTGDDTKKHVYMAKVDSNGKMLHLNKYTLTNISYGNTGNEASSAFTTTDGGYLVAFQSGIMKLAVDETVKWSKEYLGANIMGAKQTADGGYILCGNVLNGLHENISLIKTDASGALKWSKTYGGSKDDIALSVVLTKDGGYALAGGTKSYGAGQQDGFIIKTDSNGSALWTRTYGGTGDDEFTDIIASPDGGFALSGISNNNGIFLKTDSKGLVQWVKGIDSSSTVKLIQFADGSYLVGGNRGKKSFGKGQSTFLIKTDSSGSVQWTKKYICDGMYELKTTLDGGYIFSGDLTFSNQSIYVTKTDANGNNGCLLPLFSANISSIILADTSASFAKTSVKLSDSSLTVTKTTITGIRDTVVCNIFSGINEPIDVGSFKIYPNPSASGIFNVSFETMNSGSWSVNIFDAQGRLAYESAFIPKTVVLDMRNLKKGFYIANFISEYKIEHRKLIIE